MTCARVVDRTMSLFAAEGYETAASKARRGAPALPVERAYRDARAFRIAGGVEFLIDFAAAKVGIVSAHYAPDGAPGAPEIPAESEQGPPLSPRNLAHLRFVREGLERFRRTCRELFERHPKAAELLERQRTLILLNQLANELFTMSVVIARAGLLASQGESSAEDLADVFCSSARHRLEDAFRQLTVETEPEYARISAAWVSCEGPDFLLADVMASPPCPPSPST